MYIHYIWPYSYPVEKHGIFLFTCLLVIMNEKYTKWNFSSMPMNFEVNVENDNVTAACNNKFVFCTLSWECIDLWSWNLYSYYMHEKEDACWFLIGVHRGFIEEICFRTIYWERFDLWNLLQHNIKRIFKIKVKLYAGKALQRMMDSNFQSKRSKLNVTGIKMLKDGRHLCFTNI